MYLHSAGLQQDLVEPGHHVGLVHWVHESSAGLQQDLVEPGHHVGLVHWVHVSVEQRRPLKMHLNGALSKQTGTEQFKQYSSIKAWFTNEQSHIKMCQGYYSQLKPSTVLLIFILHIILYFYFVFYDIFILYSFALQVNT